MYRSRIRTQTGTILALILVMTVMIGGSAKAVYTALRSVSTPTVSCSSTEPTTAPLYCD